MKTSGSARACRSAAMAVETKASASRNRSSENELPECSSRPERWNSCSKAERTCRPVSASRSASAALRKPRGQACQIRPLVSTMSRTERSGAAPRRPTGRHAPPSGDRAAGEDPRADPRSWAPGAEGGECEVCGTHPTPQRSLLGKSAIGTARARHAGEVGDDQETGSSSSTRHRASNRGGLPSFRRDFHLKWHENRRAANLRRPSDGRSSGEGCWTRVARRRGWIAADEPPAFELVNPYGRSRAISSATTPARASRAGSATSASRPPTA